MDVLFNQLSYDVLDEDMENLFIDKVDIMGDLPVEMLIDENDFKETLKNLYKYFIKDKVISLLPYPYFDDYVEEFAERAIYRKKFNRVLNELKNNLN